MNETSKLTTDEQNRIDGLRATALIWAVRTYRGAAWSSADRAPIIHLAKQYEAFLFGLRSTDTK